MGIDIKFGKVSGRNSEAVTWRGLELPSDPDALIEFVKSHEPSERPAVNISALALDEWRTSVSEADALFSMLVPGSTGANIGESNVIALDENVLSQIDLLPEVGEEWEVNKAQWMKRWAHQARDQFGDDARILIG